MPTWGKKKVDVNIYFHLIQILDIDINKGKIALKINLTLQWRDTRLTFLNINNDTNVNVLSEKEFAEIWKPKVVYTNKDTNPYYVNVPPTVMVGMENPNVPFIIDRNLGTVKKEYPGEENSLFWTSTIRYSKKII
jgi:Neurotransmitter-gated ion-channel ligand binding domain